MKKDINYLKKIIETTISAGGDKAELSIWLTLFNDLDDESQQKLILTIEEQYELLKKTS